jgi:xanthine/CO dehydrogenase XdhC/CoxF family maturation factor
VAPETLARAAEFIGLLASTSSREEALKKAVKAGFGDSYFFYDIFGISGL